MRKLTLRKDVLVELTTDDLSAVVGGTGNCFTDTCGTLPLSAVKCISDQWSCTW